MSYWTAFLVFLVSVSLQWIGLQLSGRIPKNDDFGAFAVYGILCVCSIFGILRVVRSAR